MNIKAFIQRHSVITYFVIAFLISYGGFLVVVGPKTAAPAPTRDRERSVRWMLLGRHELMGTACGPYNHPQGWRPSPLAHTSV